jgi:hypothetical protein
MHDVRPFLPWPFAEPGTLLYVGFRPDACAWLDELAAAGNHVTVLEVWPPNVMAGLGDPRVERFVVGDVRRMNGALAARYDHVWWWHGPERVEKRQFPGTLLRLAAKTRGTLVVASPWDRDPDDPVPLPWPQWEVRVEDFTALGLDVRFHYADGGEPGEIVGWMRT